MSILANIVRSTLPRGGHVVAMYSAYFDESDDGKAERYLAVGGYAVRSDHIAAFEDDWNATLREFGLDFFHMVDCAHHAGPFRGRAAEADKAARAMIANIKKHVGFGLACVTPLHRYERDPALPGPYAFIAQNCVTSVIYKILEVDPDPKISFFFEQGYQAHRELDEFFNSPKNNSIHRYISSHSFVKKDEVCLIQAGDVLAWQVAKNVRSTATMERQPRKDYLSLMEAPHIFIYVMPRDGEILLAVDQNPKELGLVGGRIVRELFSTTKAEFEHPALQHFNKSGRG